MSKNLLDRILVRLFRQFFEVRTRFFTGKPNRTLIPDASASGRSLAAIVAIMAFLASLTASVALRVTNASEGWQSSVSREITIQIRPVLGSPIDAEINKANAILGKTRGLSDIKIYSKAEAEKLLEPWLGSGLDFDQLPVPRMITARVDKNEPPDFETLRATLAGSVKGVSLDDHRLWTNRLALVAQTMVAATFAILALVIAAAGFAIAFATRGAMISNREIIEVLHFVGASDAYIARQFQEHFLWIGIKGGMIGGIAAIALFLLLNFVAKQLTAMPGGNEMMAIFGTFSMGLSAFLAVFATALLMAFVAALVSRITANRTIRGLG